MATCGNFDIGLAQVLIKCPLCPTKVEMFCKTCEFDLCSKCVGKHMLSSPSLKHNVAKYSMKFANISEPFCPIHSNQHCYFHCQDCEVPLCNKCIIAKTHFHHNIIEMKEYFEINGDKKAKQTLFLEEKFVPECNLIIEQIKKNISDLPKVSAKLKSEVSKKAKEQHKAISKEAKKQHQEVNRDTNKHLTEITGRENKDRTILQRSLLETQNKLRDAQETIRKNKKLLESRSDGAAQLQCQVEEPRDLSQSTEVSLGISCAIGIDLYCNKESKSTNVYLENDSEDIGDDKRRKVCGPFDKSVQAKANENKKKISMAP